MTTRRRTRIVRVTTCLVALLASGWATSQALAEEAPAPTLPAPPAVAPEPAQPPVLPQPDPAPPRAAARPAPAPAGASTPPRPSAPPRVVWRPAARATPVTPVPRSKARPKPKPQAAAAKPKLEPTATVVQEHAPVDRPARPVVVAEPVRSERGLITSSLLGYAVAFVAGLAVAVGLTTAIVSAQRRKRRAPKPESPPDPVPTHVPSSMSTPAPATPRPDPPKTEPILFDPPDPPAAPAVDPPAAQPGWEYCEIDWWRGYVKANFVARSTAPEDGDYIVRESPMFRWRGNGIPEPTPASVAAHEQLLEKLNAEGWEADSGEAPAWYAKTLRRRRM